MLFTVRTIYAFFQIDLVNGKYPKLESLLRNIPREVEVKFNTGVEDTKDDSSMMQPAHARPRKRHTEKEGGRESRKKKSRKFGGWGCNVRALN